MLQQPLFTLQHTGGLGKSLVSRLSLIIIFLISINCFEIYAQTNTISIISSPAKIYPTGKYKVRVNYTAAEAGTIKIFLLTSTYEWKGEGMVNVTAGSGTTDVTVDAYAAEGTGYGFYAKVMNSSGVEAAGANVATEVLAAPTSNALTIQAAPAEIFATGTYQLTLLYNALQPGSIVVFLLDDVYNWKGEGTETISAAGAGSTVINITVTDTLEGGSGSGFYAFLKDTSGVNKVEQSKMVEVVYATLPAPRNYYVSVSGDNSDGTTPAKAYTSIQRAANKVNPGDSVIVLNGTYSGENWRSVLAVTRSGTADKWIAFKNYPGHSPKIKNSGFYGTVDLVGKYIVFDGFEVIGNNDDYTLEQATAIYNAFKANGYSSFDNKLFSAGIGLNSHQIVRNCKVHSFGGGGINGGLDYLTIENNLVYECGWYGPFGMSGISVFNPVNLDGKTDEYKIKITGNISHSNYNYFPCECFPGNITDGNGIILDDFLNYQRKDGDPYKNVAYTGKTLVANNIVFNNGGSGIHSLHGINLDIVNNTSYKNGQHPDLSGEIFCNGCKDSNILNNILYGKEGEDVSHDWNNNTNVLMDYNIYYDGTLTPSMGGQAIGPNSKVADPLFISTPDPANATVEDFRLQNSSPAVDAGTSAKAPSVDFSGARRPENSKYDIGAFEHLRPVYVDSTDRTESGSIQVSDILSVFLKERAFDNNKNTKWLIFSSIGYIQYAFKGDEAYAINSYTVSSANDFPDRDPSSWTLKGSDDGINWVALDTRSGIVFPNRLQTLKFVIENKTPYKIYRLDNIRNNRGKILQIAEIQMFGPAKMREADNVATSGAKNARTASFEEPEGTVLSSLVTYPNPVKNIVYVQLHTRKKAETRFVITTLLGEKVIELTKLLDEGNNEVVIPIQSIKSGFYLLNVSQGKEVATKKIIVQ